MGGSALRVAVFSESYLPYLSGVTVSADALARGLGALGHRVLVVAPRPSYDGAPPAVSPGPDPEYAWLPSYELAGLVPPGYRMPWPAPWPAAREVAAFRPDVVHAQSPFVTGLGALRAARRAGVPLVFTHHTRFGEYRHYLGPMAAASSRLLDAYLARFWRACAAIVAPSESLAAEIRDSIGRRRRPIIRAIPTGVDVSGIARLPAIDPRPEFGWPRDAVVAVTLGRLAVEKNVGLLLDAVAGAAAAVPAMRLLVIGSGPAEDLARERAAAPDLAGRIAFTGLLPRDEALARLKCCDLFVLASRTETQGLVLAEAAASGLPTVALEGPAISETVRDGVDGHVVPFDDPRRSAARMADAIAALAFDAHRRAAMGAAAREGAERLDAARSVRRVVELYRDVIA